MTDPAATAPAYMPSSETHQRIGPGVARIATVVIVLLFLIVIALNVLRLFPIVRGSALYNQLFLTMGIVAGALSLIAAVVYFIATTRVNSRGRRDAAAHAARTAGLDYTRQASAPYAVTSLFGSGERGFVYDRITRPVHPSLEIGNYQYSRLTRLDKALTVSDLTPDWGYAIIQLERHLPQMALRFTGRRTSRDYFFEPMPAGNQKLSFEGDFDRYFTLSVPVGYERDALYIFTPDLMALMVDEVSGMREQGLDRQGLDATIIDDMLVISAPVPWDHRTPGMLERLLAIEAVVGAKVDRRATNYRDERSERPGRIGPQGRRLERSMLRQGIVIALLAVVPVALVLWRLVSP